MADAPPIILHGQIDHKLITSITGITSPREQPQGLRAPTVRIDTHGCKLNQADSQQLTRELARAGYEVVGDDLVSDVFILNTCTVTHVADRKARQAIRAAKRRNPSAFVVVTGCYAQRAGDEVDSMAEVDLVVGNVDKSTLVKALDGSLPRTESVCAVGDDSSLAPVMRHRSRAMLKIQEGCDQVCSYCIVPKVRGRERSIPVGELVSAANAYGRSGCQEIVLTGTQLGSYGFDLEGIDIVELLREMLERTDIPRIRVSSLQPQDISDDLLALWSDSRLCPHFHIPLQSGSDRILKLMRRRYSRKQFLETIDRVYSSVSGVAVTADVIAGFPGETEADFQSTVDACIEAGLASVHVFPYSVRPGTSAAYLPEHVDPDRRTDRARSLAAVADRLKSAFRSRLLGSYRPVLWENTRPGPDSTTTWSGLTDNYIRVSTDSSIDLSNTITPAKLISLDHDIVRAQVDLSPAPVG